MQEQQHGKRYFLAQQFEILAVSLRLGLTSFGGPTAHLGFFHDEYVVRRRWLDVRSFTDLTALAQFLPGPASSQVGIGIGIHRGGLLGGLMAFLGFTLPSALIMFLLAVTFDATTASHAGWIHGLKLGAVAIVAGAVVNMGRNLARGWPRASIACVTTILLLLYPAAHAQVVLILLAGLVGSYLFRHLPAGAVVPWDLGIPRRLGIACLATFLALLVLLPMLALWLDHPALDIFDIFYRAGSLVFGGGHVVLPLLQRELVPGGWVDNDTFLTGYGAAQALPGPLLTFASYLGATARGLTPATGALIATAAVFLPSFLILIGILPFWETLREKPWAQGGLQGINAAVVGILAAALYDPIFTSSVHSLVDLAIVAVLFALLTWRRIPSWLVVALGAGLGLVPALA